MNPHSLPPDDDASQPPPTALPAQVDVRSVSLAVLTGLAIVFALHWASAVVIPLLLGLMCSYALSPIVDRLQRSRVPRALAAGLLLLSLVGGLSWTAYTMTDDATALIASLPEATQKVRAAMRAQRGAAETPIDKVQQAAAQLEQAAQEGGPQAPAAARGVTRVRIERPQFDIKDYLWSGTLGLATSVGQGVVVVFITFFLLASGSSFRRKMVRLAGPTFAQKRITVQALDEITQQIQRYLLVQIATSALVGVVTGLAFWAIGLDNAAVWGIIAALSNLVPYICSIAIMAASSLVAFLQFNGIELTLLVAGVSLLIHLVIGNLLVPWLTSRTSSMNPVAVFVGVIFWGWLWGVWGLLLSIPIIVIVKVVSQHVKQLQPLAELLGE